MNNIINKFKTLVLLGSVSVFSLHSMQQVFPGEVREHMIRMALESSFGTNFEPQKEINIGTSVRSAAVSPDRKTVITSWGDTAYVWDIETQKLVQKFTVSPTISILSVECSPDGKTVLTGSGDKKARLWDIKTGKQIQEFTGHKNVISAVAYSPNGTTVLTGSYDATVCLWDAKSGELIKEFTGSNSIDAILSVAFSPDGKFIAAGTFEGKIFIWDTETKELVGDFGDRNMYSPVSLITFSPDGKSVLIGSNNVAKLWDRQQGILLQEFKGHFGNVVDISSLAFSRNGAFVFTGRAGAISVWDAATGKELRRFNVNNYPSPIKKIALSADEETMITVAGDGSIIVWGVSWDPKNWSKGMTEEAYKAAQEFYVTQLHEPLGKGISQS